MTKADIDRRVDEIENHSEKIAFVKDWLFDLDMTDHWDDEDYELSRLLTNKLNELKGDAA